MPKLIVKRWIKGKSMACNAGIKQKSIENIPNSLILCDYHCCFALYLKRNFLPQISKYVESVTLF